MKKTDNNYWSMYRLLYGLLLTTLIISSLILPAQAAEQSSAAGEKAEIKIAAPLFIVRDLCSKDLFGTLDKIAACGYDGVELFGFFGHKPEEIAAHLASIHLIPLGNHVSYADFKNNLEKTIQEHKIIGVKYITIGSFPRERQPGGELYRQTLEEIKQYSAAARQAGITLLYHNHAGELTKRGDKTVLSHWLDDAPFLSLEPDVGWMKIAGADPLPYLIQYKDRCPVIHVKDFRPETKTAGKSFIFRPIGYGVVNFPQLLPAILDCNPDWIVCDHDAAYDGNPISELELSLNYVRALLKLEIQGNVK